MLKKNEMVKILLKNFYFLFKLCFFNSNCPNIFNFLMKVEMTYLKSQLIIFAHGGETSYTYIDNNFNLIIIVKNFKINFQTKIEYILKDKY